MVFIETRILNHIYRFLSYLMRLIMEEEPTEKDCKSFMVEVRICLMDCSELDPMERVRRLANGFKSMDCKST